MWNRRKFCRMLAIFTLVVMAACTMADATSWGRLVCPVNSQRLITGTSTLLNPVTGISSLSEDTSSNPASNFIDPRAWCTAEDTYNVSGQYVELSFTEPIVATILVSGGKQGIFVQNFSLYYAESSDSGLQPYGVLNPVQNFIVSSITTSDAFLALEIPFMAKRIKFVVNSGETDPFGRTCWSMKIYGCTASEAQTITEEEPSASPHSPTSSPTTDNLEHPTTAATSTELPLVNCPPIQDSFAQRDLLLVVIPSAVVLIVVVLIAVTSGVIICLCVSKPPQGESPTYESVKEKIMNKRTKNLVDSGVTNPGLYDQPRPQFYDVPKASLPSASPFRNSTSSIGSNMEVKNPVYLEKKQLQEMSMAALKQLPSDDGNDYADVMEAVPKGAERQTQVNTGYSGSYYPSPPEIPNNDNVRPPLPDPNMLATRTMSLDNTAASKYSRVAKGRQTGGDGGSERGRSASPVIKSHYMSTNAAITEELNRLTTELENSLKGQS